jgi:glycosyltransferase involved in cell wall biosynthesis
VPQQHGTGRTVHILTYTSLFPNSEEPSHGIFIYQRVAHLARRIGNAVTVIAPIPYYPRWAPGKTKKRFGEIARQERVGDLCVLHPRYPLVPKISMPVHALLMALGSVQVARRLHAKNAFDCIDAHFVYPDATAAILLGKILRLPVIVSARGTDLTHYPSYRLIRPMLRWTLSQAAGIVAVSDSLKQAIIRLGIRADCVQTIPNGIDAARFFPMERGEAREQLNVPKDDHLLVSVGHLTVVKSQDLLVSAMGLLVPRHPFLRLYLIGEGPTRSRLSEQIHRLRLHEHVFLMGRRPNEELHIWFSAADLSCLASSREGWPNVVSESLGCGTPVVATRVGGVPEIITSGDLGLLVERHPQSIAEGIEAALLKPWDRHAIAERARQRTWNRVAEECDHYLRASSAKKRSRG